MIFKKKTVSVSRKIIIIRTDLVVQYQKESLTELTNALNEGYKLDTETFKTKSTIPVNNAVIYHLIKKE